MPYSILYELDEEIQFKLYNNERNYNIISKIHKHNSMIIIVIFYIVEDGFDLFHLPFQFELLDEFVNILSEIDSEVLIYTKNNENPKIKYSIEETETISIVFEIDLQEYEDFNHFILDIRREDPKDLYTSQIISIKITLIINLIEILTYIKNKFNYQKLKI